MSVSRLLIVILVLSAALRLYGLADESLWLDEGFTAHRATESLRELAIDFRHETQTVLYYVGELVWCAAFGTSEYALRLPSAVFGVAAVWGVFLLAREIFSASVGLWAALLLAVNPFAIFYSQEARPYSLFLAAAIFSLYFLLRMLRRLDKRAILLYLLATSIALYSHPLAPLLLLTHIVIWLIYRNDAEYPGAAHHVRQILQIFLFAALLYLPQFLFMFGTIVSKTQGTSRAGWIPVPDWNVFQQTAQQYFMYPVLAIFAFAVLAIGAVAYLRRDRRSRRAALLLLTVVLACVAAPWLISVTVTPVYVVRYTLPALAAVIIALAWVFSRLPIAVRSLLVAIFLVLSGVALNQYYFGLDKEPWRETAQFVTEKARPGDLVALQASYVRQVFTYYFHAPAGVQVCAPWLNTEIPEAVDSASRIILVQSYDTKPQPSTAELLMRVRKNRTATQPVEIVGRRPVNPWAAWVPPIRVTLFERTPEPAAVIDKIETASTPDSHTSF